MGIDYVVPMVFNDDIAWRRDFLITGMSFMEGHTRWRSWGTERLLIQLVRKNMPWVRNIYILLARESQKKDWMIEEGIKVVYHREFIPEEFRPTFNSCTIEMFLHKIPGLSEYFIYGNDDMYPLLPLREEDFFEGDKPCIHMDSMDFPEDKNIFHKSCMNGQRFIERLLGKNPSSIWYKNGHSIAPIRKSTCESVWRLGSNEIKASITPFRTDKNFSQYIYSWWEYYSNSFVDRMPQRRFVNAGTITLEELKKIIERREGILCINDSWGVEDYNAMAKVAREALENVICQ